MPLFRVDPNKDAKRIRAGGFELERHLQHIIEQNLDEIFGVRFVTSEFAFNGEQSGRIDTLGLDSDGAPTIIEYKRDSDENVITQGLYYMNWLVNHRGDYIVLAQGKFGSDVEINWSHPRLIIVAQNYDKRIIQAVKQMGEGIELWKYLQYGDDLLHLEPIYGQQRSQPVRPLPTIASPVRSESAAPGAVYTLDYHLKGKSDGTRPLFEQLRQSILGLATIEGEIIETPNKVYISYRHGKNFCEVQVMRDGLKLYLDINVLELKDTKHLARDISNIGHLGTGDTEVKLNSPDQIDYVMGLIEQAYRLTL